MFSSSNGEGGREGERERERERERECGSERDGGGGGEKREGDAKMMCTNSIPTGKHTLL